VPWLDQFGPSAAPAAFAQPQRMRPHRSRKQTARRLHCDTRRAD
jgi:hypothetical protein